MGFSAAAVTAAGTAYAAHESASGAKSAAAAGNAGQQAAIDAANRAYGETRQNITPYLQTGYNANTLLSKYLGTYTGGFMNNQDQANQVLAVHPELAGKSNNSPAWQAAAQAIENQKVATAQKDPMYGSLLKNFTSADLPTDDGYQFQLQQGQQALQRTQAANGGLLSGAAAKAMDNYTQGLASTEYQNAYSNYNNNRNTLYSYLSGQSGQGLNAAGTLSNQATNNATAVGNASVAQGNNNAAATTQGNNSVLSAISQLTGQNSPLQAYLSSSGTGLSANTNKYAAGGGIY